jgi:hypothetical protein
VPEHAEAFEEAISISDANARLCAIHTLLYRLSLSRRTFFSMLIAKLVRAWHNTELPASKFAARFAPLLTHKKSEAYDASLLLLTCVRSSGFVAVSLLSITVLARLSLLSSSPVHLMSLNSSLAEFSRFLVSVMNDHALFLKYQESVVVDDVTCTVKEVSVAFPLHMP